MTTAEPDVDVQYEITDYRVGNHGLEVYVEMVHVDEVVRAFDMPADQEGVQSFTNAYGAYWERVGTVEDREIYTNAVNSYIENQNK